jgi:hypothetical protein
MTNPHWGEANEEHVANIQRQRERLAANGKDTSKLDEELTRLEAVKNPPKTEPHTRRFGNSDFNYDWASANQEFDAALRDIGKAHYKANVRVANKAGAAVGGVAAGLVGGVAYARNRKIHKRNPYYFRTQEGKRQKIKNHWYAAGTAATYGGGLGAMTHQRVKLQAVADAARYGYSPESLRATKGKAVGAMGLGAAGLGAYMANSYQHVKMSHRATARNARLKKSSKKSK